jgi:hypothetical protein
MNNNQKKLTLIYICIFLASIILVPQEFNLSPDEGMPKTISKGYEFITNLRGEIAIKTLVVEWFGIIVSYMGFFFYLRDQ